MRAPGVRIGPRFTRRLRPGAEVQWEQIAPRLQTGEILIRHPGVVKRPGQVVSTLPEESIPVRY
jgi:hypothetical protein